MRRILAALALACVMAAPSRAAPHPPGERPSVLAMMSVSDVLRTIRCAPPFGCKGVTPKPRAKRRRN